jgi:hypothetical protein
VLLRLSARLDGQLETMLGCSLEHWSSSRLFINAHSAPVPFPALVMHGQLQRSLVLRIANKQGKP